MPSLDLTIALGADGASRLARRRVAYPWSVGRGYPGKPGEPLTVIPQVAGAGLLAGDHVLQRIHVAQDAALRLQSAGAMLTYGTPGGPACRTDWALDVEAGARAFVISEPYVLFPDAGLRLRQTITISPGARVVACEGMVSAPGASTSEWQTETLVQRPDGTLLFRDRQRASAEMLATNAGLPGGWTAFGTVLVLTPDAQRMRAVIEATVRATTSPASVGVAPLPRGLGVCARIAAPDGQTLRDALFGMSSAALLCA
ncbi:MAG: urease accessory protein UreD [Pseudomonadota bacterium]